MIDLKELSRNKSRLDEATIKLEHEISACVHFTIREDLLRRKLQVEEDIGISYLQKELIEQNRTSGRSFCSSGRDFETQSHDYIITKLLPDLSIKHGLSIDRLQVVSNVTLKLPGNRGSSGEIDAFVVEIEPADAAQRIVVRNVLLLIEM